MNIFISGLLTQTLEEIVRKEDTYRTAKTRQKFFMERGFDMGYGQSDWNREVKNPFIEKII